jgi:N-acetylmuramoyl-L-alanine amidase
MAKPGRQRGLAPLAAHRTSSRRAGLFAAFAALLAVAPLAGLRADPAPPIAIAAQIEVRGHESRLTFTLQSCVPAEAYVLDSPARAIIDLPEVNFQIDPREGLAAPETKPRRHARPKHDKAEPQPPLGAAASGSAPVSGLLASYRFGKLAPGKSRIVADLTGPARSPPRSRPRCSTTSSRPRSPS